MAPAEDGAGGSVEAVRVALTAFEPSSPGAAAVRDELLALASSGDPFARSSALHLTASALILHPGSGRVLLRWHPRVGAWMQVGGHGDAGEWDLVGIALREAREESGLADLAVFPDPERPAIVQVVIVDVPPGGGEPAHRHGDVRYLMATATPDLAHAEHADAPLRWCELAEALDLVEEENLRHFIGHAQHTLEIAPA